jgi:hypothetical protein
MHERISAAPEIDSRTLAIRRSSLDFDHLFYSRRMTPTPSRRRWFQFGLRTMFVAVSLFALWLG